MFSVTAADVLAVADSTTLKHSPSILTSCLAPTDEYTVSAWAADNSVLYLSSAREISRYDPSSNQLKLLHTLEEDQIRCLIAKDDLAVIFCAGKAIHLLECGGTTVEVTEIFNSQRAEILSLSLSNDSTLLASASHNAVYVHDLSIGSHIVLRGISPLERATLCAFHPHSRTRLLVAVGKHLLVFDTTRSSGPSRTISMGEAAPGDIVTLASSPFSKTLVAVATSAGYVGLVDLDKEKGLFRALNMKESLTTIAFSPEGASIYFGTESGRLLVQDLRSLDKVPKSIVVSELGNPIRTLAVQKKPRNSSEDGKAKSSPKISVKKTVATPTNASPAQPRSVRPGVAAVATPARKALLNTGIPKRSPSLKAVNPKKVLSPSRDPQGNSLTLNARGAGKTAITKVTKSSLSSPAPRNAKSRRSSGKATMPSESTPRATSLRPRKMSISQLIEPSITTHFETTTSEAVSSIFNPHEPDRFRTSVSSISLAPPKSGTTTASRSRRAVSSTSISSVASRQKHASSPPHAPPVPSPLVNVTTNVSQALPIPKILKDSRTPSPDLPDMKADKINPIPSPKKKGMAVLGLGTPEVKAWIKSSQTSKRDTAKDTARVKSVGSKGGANGVDKTRQAEDLNDVNPDEDENYDCERSLSMQVTPRRPLPTTSSPQATQSHGYSQSWDASPLRPRAAGHMSGTPSAGSAHEFLRTIVKDVMYDFQKETKAEMMGLHLDLVRMGRGWKQELRVLMEEYVGDLNDLREENRRLREENERLRSRY